MINSGILLAFGAGVATWTAAALWRLIPRRVRPGDGLDKVGLVAGHGGTWSGAVDGVFLVVEPNPGGGWLWLTPIAPAVSTWPLAGGPLHPGVEPPLSGLTVDGPLHVETLAALGPLLRLELPTWNGVIRAGYLGIVDPTAPTAAEAWHIASLFQGVARERLHALADAPAAIRLMARRDPTPEFRARALDVLARFAPEEGLEIAEAEAWEKDTMLAASVARLRYACGRPVGAAAAGLAAATLTRPADLGLAVSALADRADTEALAHLLPHARRCADREVALAATHLSARFPDPAAADDLATLVGGASDPLVAATALRALARLVPGEIEGLCAAQLGRGGPRQEAAIALLAEHASVGVVPALLAFASRAVGAPGAEARAAVRRIQDRAGGARGALSVAEGGELSLASQDGAVDVVDLDR